MGVYLGDTTLVNGGGGGGMEHFCCTGNLVLVKACKSPSSSGTSYDVCSMRFTVPFSGRRIYKISNCDWGCPTGNCFRCCANYISEPVNGYLETMFSLGGCVYNCWPQGCCYTSYPSGIIYLEKGVCYNIGTGVMVCDRCTGKCTTFQIFCRGRKSS